MTESGVNKTEKQSKDEHCQRPPGCVNRIAILPCNALSALSVSIELESSAAKVTSVKSAQGLRLTKRQPDP